MKFDLNKFDITLALKTQKLKLLLKGDKKHVDGAGGGGVALTFVN